MGDLRKRRNRVAVEIVYLHFPGLKQPWALGRNRFAVRETVKNGSPVIDRCDPEMKLGEKEKSLQSLFRWSCATPIVKITQEAPSFLSPGISQRSSVLRYRVVLHRSKWNTVLQR